MIEVVEWLDENALRAFPLVTPASKTANTNYILPDGLILDLCLIYTANTTNSYETLNSIQSDGTTVTFTFSDNVVFTVPTASSGRLYLIGTNSSMLTVDASYFGAIPIATHIFTNLYVEPSTIHEYSNQWLGVTSLGFSQDYLTTNDAGYSPELYLVPQTAQYLTGDIQFFQGFNVGLNFDTTKDVIDIYVGSSYGIPLACENFFIDPALTDCSRIVSYINGVPAAPNGTFTFAPGNNVNLALGTSVANFHDGINTGELANTHSLFIGFNFYQTDLCQTVNIIPTT